MNYDDYEPTFEEMMMLLEAMGDGAKIIHVTTGNEVTLKKG
tara:strand:- start:276 stop:398 length:123 start_codon:yes stop_codon:yes gene_type:complete